MSNCVNIVVPDPAYSLSKNTYAPAIGWCQTHNRPSSACVGVTAAEDALKKILAICESDWPESKGPNVTIDAIRHHAREALKQ